MIAASDLPDPGSSVFVDMAAGIDGADDMLKMFDDNDLAELLHFVTAGLQDQPDLQTAYRKQTHTLLGAILIAHAAIKQLAHDRGVPAPLLRDGFRRMVLHAHAGGDGP